MYARMKVVYGNDKSFVMEACAPDKDELFTQLFTTFEDAKCKYNPSDGDQFGIKHVEVQCISTHGAERTCRNEHGHCSVCGAIMYDAPNYCQNCGAEVVGE